MRPTTSTPPSPEPSSPKSVVTRRHRKAPPPPLSDVTNLLLPETPTPIKPTRAARRPLPTPSSTCSSTASVTNPSSAAVLESVLKSPISTDHATHGTTRRNPTTTITTTTNNNKGKEPVAATGTASCPPLGRATRKNSREDSMPRGTLPISSSAPYHGAKKKRPLPTTPKLPEDFVKKQRAYFADVDAFELPEEVVSESELE